MKKNIKTIFIAIIVGFLLSSYVFGEYENKASAKATSKSIYLLQYGAYKSKENMEESCKNIQNYFYYIENNLYHVLIGITSDKTLKDKILSAYEISDNVYVKEVNITEDEFIQNLDQYDKLIKSTEDNLVIINSEKQILTKYKELVLNNESIN